MLIDFFYGLRAAKLPVSVTEYLALLEALRAGVLDGGEAGDDPGPSVERFYYLARTVLVKDEVHFDKFDRAFDAYFRGVKVVADFAREVPLDWLRGWLRRELSPEQRARVDAMDWDALMAALEERLARQKSRHEGGSHWIGTGGTSPFGHGGFNPQGVRIGGESGEGRALKVWEQRAYADYDDGRELGTRQIKLALRRLRRFAREGQPVEFDLGGTIRRTAANAGMLEIHRMAPRQNRVNVLLLMDVGGSMDAHVRKVEELFTAARTEFKNLDFYYFHNCVYDAVWKHNQRRHSERVPTWDLIRKYRRDHRLVFVGDATMSPYEILQPGGSVESHNTDSGAEWLQRLTHAFPSHCWINPEPQGVWGYRQSIALVQGLMAQRMFPLSLQGLDAAMRLLSK